MKEIEESQRIQELTRGFNIYIAKVCSELGEYFSGKPINHQRMDKAFKEAQAVLNPASGEKS